MGQPETLFFLFKMYVSLSLAYVPIFPVELRFLKISSFGILRNYPIFKVVNPRKTTIDLNI
jgi:hypothetical protein